jgi:hypothetical protein
VKAKDQKFFLMNPAKYRLHQKIPLFLQVTIRLEQLKKSGPEKSAMSYFVFVNNTLK